MLAEVCLDPCAVEVVARGEIALCGARGGRALAVPILAVDINDRSTNDAAHQQAGYAIFLMGGTTAASSASESNLLSSDGGANNYTVTLQASDDHQDENTVTAGVQDTTGQIDDRDRATPVDGGAFTYGQMYDDLIFAGTSAGPTGGIDLTITGGTLAFDHSTLITDDFGFTSLVADFTAEGIITARMRVRLSPTL